MTTDPGTPHPDGYEKRLQACGSMAGEQGSGTAAEGRPECPVRPERSPCRTLGGGMVGISVPIIDPAWSPSVYRHPRLSRGQRFSSQDFSIEIVDDLPEGPLLVGREGEPHLGAVYGRGFATTRFRAMELITILDRCYRFRGFEPYRGGAGAGPRPAWV